MITVSDTPTLSCIVPGRYIVTSRGRTLGWTVRREVWFLPDGTHPWRWVVRDERTRPVSVHFTLADARHSI